VERILKRSSWAFCFVLFFAVLLPAFAADLPTENCRYSELVTVAEILDRNTPAKVQHGDIVTHWTRKAYRFIARMDTTAAAKIARFRALGAEIARRHAEIEKKIPGSNLRWVYVEHSLGEGALFVGGIGHFVEIRSDGSVFHGEIDMTQAKKEQYLSRTWRPEFSKDGLDKKYVSVRRRVR
jgi:hypothetical protein